MSSYQVSVPSGIEEQLREFRNLLLRGEVAILGANNQQQSIPAPLQSALVRILSHIQQGQAITILPESCKLDPQEAADLLGVSRQYIIKLLESGKLPFHGAGTQQRIDLQDFLAYKRERDRQRREALDQIAREEVEAGTYDVFVLPEE